MPDSLFGSDSEQDVEESLALEYGTSHSESASVPNSGEACGVIQVASRNSDARVTASQLVATSVRPPISGLYLFPDAIPLSMQSSLALSLSDSSIFPASSNQAMIFDSPFRSSLPSFLSPLLDLLPSILSPLPKPLRDTIFDHTKPRQCILNLYHPGQGISAHVDLPNRYEDGIVGISLLSSTVMEFTPVHRPCEEQSKKRRRRKKEERYALRIKPGSVYVLSGEARYDYEHGIPCRVEDTVVEPDGTETRIRRGIRMSITLRRMREGAEIIGPT